MGAIRPTAVACERTRAYVSLELDGELSEFERGFLMSHLRRCASCEAYRSEVGVFTKHIREASVEAPSRGVRVPVRAESRFAGHQLGAAAAAAAVVVVGIATLLTPSTDTQERIRGGLVLRQSSPNEVGFVSGVHYRTAGSQALWRPSTGVNFIV
jgi:Putative zinc-finger